MRTKLAMIVIGILIITYTIMNASKKYIKKLFHKRTSKKGTRCHECGNRMIIKEDTEKCILLMCEKCGLMFDLTRYKAECMEGVLETRAKGYQAQTKADHKKVPGPWFGKKKEEEEIYILEQRRFDDKYYVIDDEVSYNPVKQEVIEGTTPRDVKDNEEHQEMIKAILATIHAPVN